MATEMNTDQSTQAEPEKEPMLLLDTTGSMNYRTSATDATPRKDTIREAISIIVSELAAADSQVQWCWMLALMPLMGKLWVMSISTASKRWPRFSPRYPVVLVLSPI